MVTLVNRAKVATASVGTGTITLGAAENGYQSFADAGVVNADVVRYTIEDGDAWEIGSGTYSAGTLTRVPDDSSTGSLLNLSGGAVVYVTAANEDIQQPPAEGSFVDGDKTKLDGIEAGANVTDAVNVEPLVDSHLNVSTAAVGQVLSWDGADYDWFSLSTVATTGSYTDLLNLPALSTVATTGSYNDLSDLPALAGDNPTFASVSVTGSITENVYAISGAAAALDPANGTIQTHTLTGATTYTDSLASGQSVTLVIPGTANTVTWPTIKWLGGAAPALDATNDTIISVFKIGTTLYGSSLGVFS